MIQTAVDSHAFLTFVSLNIFQSCFLNPLGLTSLSHIVCTFQVVNPFKVSINSVLSQFLYTEKYTDFYLHISSVNIASKKKKYPLLVFQDQKIKFSILFCISKDSFFPSDADQQRREKLKKELARCERELKLPKTEVQANSKSNSKSLFNTLQTVRQYFYLLKADVSKVLHSGTTRPFGNMFTIGKNQ